MRHESKKRRGPIGWLANRTWRFWVMLTPSLALMYVLGFGALGWYSYDLPDFVKYPLIRCYRPLVWIIEERPNTVFAKWLWWYHQLGP